MKLEATLDGHTNWVVDCAFSASGRWLITAGAKWDRTVRIWNVRRRTSVATLEGVADAIAPHPRQGLFALAMGRRVELHRWTDGSPEQLIARARWRICRLCFSPDGRLLAICSSDEGLGRDRNDRLRLINMQLRRTIWSVSHDTGVINTIAFSADSRLLASAGDSGDISLWSTAFPLRKRSLRTDCRHIHSICFTPDGQLLFTGWLTDNILCVVDPLAGHTIRAIVGGGQGGPMGPVAVSPNGQYVATGAALGFLTLLSYPSLAVLDQAEAAHTAGVQHVVFSPDGALLASCGGESAPTFSLLKQTFSPVKLWRIR